MGSRLLANTPPDGPSFMAAPVELDPLQVDSAFAFLGIPYGVPYTLEDVSSPAAAAPAAVRHVCHARGMDDSEYPQRFDFDLGRPLADGAPLRIIDCGDVPGDLHDIEGNESRATAAVRGILSGGAVPLVVGGDHSVPPFVLAAYEDYGPIDVVQVDAHLDNCEEWNGVRAGYSSPMYRLRQMPWVRDIVQVGLRGSGSARQHEVDNAAAAGNHLVPAYEVHERGFSCVVERLRNGGRFYITLDVDGLEPSIAPATDATAPGGLTHYQVVGILRGMAAKGEIVGIDICEFWPHLDVHDLTAMTIVRVLLNVIGLCQRPAHRSR